MKRTLLGFGLASLVAVAFTAGCSSNGSTVSGSGGSNGNSSGGSNGNGSGGSNGNSSGGSNGNSSGGSNGNSSGGSNGSGGGSGSGGATACAKASDTLITDFSGSGGQVGAPYLGADTDLHPPTVDTSGGALVITVDTGAATTMYPYAFVGLGFNACTDASAHTGVTFNISGTLSDGCTVQFSAVDNEHNAVKDTGTCTAANCYPSAMIFTLPSSATDVSVNFLDQTGGGADPSAAVVDPTQLKGIQWQVNVPATGDGCKGTITIDNVNFK